MIHKERLISTLKKYKDTKTGREFLSRPDLKGVEMPVMPRLNNKATKIAYKVVGIPANIKHKKTREEKRIDYKLRYDETSRVR